VIVVSLISPATLLTLTPDTKVRKDPGGTADAAVNEAGVPADGGLQASVAAVLALHTLPVLADAGWYVAVALALALGLPE